MAFENRYSVADRLLHQLAFSTRKAQVGLADLEDVVFRDQLARHELDRPLFITGLPRAGTTLLLELCVASGTFASHTYRYMPFVLIPMLWNRFSQGFRRFDAPRERAHGDGMLVSVDSPEAFEETVWIAFWPKHYQRDRIVPWREEEDGVFRDFLTNHFKKIVALSAQAGDGLSDLSNSSARYASKNNLNIARIAWPARHFPDELFGIPFRDPLQQCASLRGAPALRLHGPCPPCPRGAGQSVGPAGADCRGHRAGRGVQRPRRGAPPPSTTSGPSWDRPPRPGRHTRARPWGGLRLEEHTPYNRASY